MNKKPNHLIKIFIILISINLILSGCGGSSYETSSEPRFNVEPIANKDEFTISEDSSIDLVPQILSNDTDEDGDKLTPEILIAPIHGSVIPENNNFIYTPSKDFNGDDSLVYAISDGYGGTSSATVEINITAVNDAPIVSDDFIIEEDTSTIINVLSNDIDIDGDALSLVNI